jgi:predicted DsbA family dithiol-disulfide isomerase
MFNALQLDGVRLDGDGLEQLAKASRLDVDAFKGCVGSGRHEQAIRASVSEVTSEGIRGTPTFVVGPTTTTGTVEGELVRGAVPLGVLQSKINAILDAKPTPAAATTSGATDKRTP